MANESLYTPLCNYNSARGFRLLLSELGLLLPQNRTHITPLKITDTLITEIETLDMLNEYVQNYIEHMKRMTHDNDLFVSHLLGIH